MRKLNEKGKMFVSYKRPADALQPEQLPIEQVIERGERKLLERAYKLINVYPDWSSDIISQYEHLYMPLKVVSFNAERICI